jgi:hypothetical protein
MTANLYTQNMKTGKKIIKLIMPFKTYEDELRDKYVNNTTELDANLKTRMCKSIEGGFPCSHGEKCRFAHSLEELVTRNCIFNDNCRFVKFRKGKLVNNESKICMNKHPHENQDEFMERTGLVKYKTISAKQEVDVKSFACDRQTNYSWAAAIKSSRAPSQDTFVFSTPPVPIGGFTSDSTTPSLTPPVPIGGFTCTTTPSLTPPVPIGGFTCDSTTPSLTPPVPIGGFTCDSTMPSLTPPVQIGGFTCDSTTPIFAPPFPIGGFTCAATTSGSSLYASSSYFGCVPTEKEIVLRVPKEFAMQALELALNTGNRCIRVEVIQ